MTFRLVFQNPVTNVKYSCYAKDLVVGDEVNQLISTLDISSPKKNGVVHDWEDMKLVWDYTFNEKMKVDPRQCKVLVSEPPMNLTKNREKMVEVHNS